MSRHSCVVQPMPLIPQTPKSKIRLVGGGARGVKEGRNLKGTRKPGSPIAIMHLAFAPLEVLLHPLLASLHPNLHIFR